MSTAVTDNREEEAERRQQDATRTDQGSPINWSEVSEEAARTILRQGELFLDAQLRIALAADQKALIAASIFSGFATAVVATTLGYWTQVGVMAPLVAGLVAAAAMFVGALLCLLAVRPSEFAPPGNEPKIWWNERNTSLNILVGLEAKNYQEHIELNDRVIRKRSSLFISGMMFGMMAPALGAIS